MPDVLRYGPGLPDERELRLCGEVAGRRTLLLGCPDPGAVVALARQGARVVVVDPSPRHLEDARKQADAAEIRAEWRQADFADVAFLAPASVDLVVSPGALGEVADLTRVFRQVHRILRPEAALVLALPHPSRRRLAGQVPAPTVSELFMGLQRSGFRVDLLAEPDGRPPADDRLPGGLLVRARKVGL